MADYELIVIGAGPAGMTAAIYAKRAGINVLMLEKLAPGGQIINTNEIQNYTGVGTVNGADLAYQMYEHTQELGIEMEYGTVKEIREEEGLKVVICQEDQKRYTSKALIIATGTKPRSLGVLGEERFKGKDISWCAICDGPKYRNQDVVVIGGGNSAVEEAIFLAGFVKSLTIVTLFDLTADPIACEKLRTFDNVTVHTYQEILEFYGEQRLTGVRFKSTETGIEQTVDCNGVFEYVGQIPMTEYISGWQVLDQYGYVKVNSQMETEVSGILAAGDCVVKHLRQVITACADGAIAAQQAAHYLHDH